MPRTGEREVSAQVVARARRVGALTRLALFLSVMGPGMITGMVDDDPTGIAGYSIAGARYGYTMLWALLLCTVALAVTQEMSGRMGVVTGKGLADVIRERFGVRIVALAMATLLVANATTTVAEFAGVAGSSEIFGVSRYISVPIAAVAVFVMVVYGSYRRLEVVLLGGSLVFAAYIVTGFLAKPDFSAVATHSVVPSFHFTIPYITVLIGLIGTTITPWGQFYLQSSVVDKGLGPKDYQFVRLDVYMAAFFTNLIAFFIIVTTAATIFAHGESADTVTDVAQALSPLAGDFAARLFAIGLLNASLMAATVIPLSTAYALCEAFGWERSVNRPLRQAPAFFSLFAGLIALGALAVLIPGIPLLTLLFLPNVVGGILLPVILVLMLLILNDRRMMGSWVNSRLQNTIGWATTMALGVLTLVYAGTALLQAFGVLNA